MLINLKFDEQTFTLEIAHNQPIIGACIAYSQNDELDFAAAGINDAEAHYNRLLGEVPSQEQIDYLTQYQTNFEAQESPTYEKAIRFYYKCCLDSSHFLYINDIKIDRDATLDAILPKLKKQENDGTTSTLTLTLTLSPMGNLPDELLTKIFLAKITDFDSLEELLLGTAKLSREFHRVISNKIFLKHAYLKTVPNIITLRKLFNIANQDEMYAQITYSMEFLDEVAKNLGVKVSNVHQDVKANERICKCFWYYTIKNSFPYAAIKGNTEMLRLLAENDEWQDEKIDSCNFKSALCWADETGHKNIIKLYSENEYFRERIHLNVIKGAISLVAKKGNIDTLRLYTENKFFRDNFAHLITVAALPCAVNEGHIDIIQLFTNNEYFREKILDLDIGIAVFSAARRSHIDILRLFIEHEYFREKIHVYKIKNIVTDAARAGKLEITQLFTDNEYWRERIPDNDIKDVILTASLSGQTEIVEHLNLYLSKKLTVQSDSDNSSQVITNAYDSGSEKPANDGGEGPDNATVDITEQVSKNKYTPKHR